MRSLSTTGLTLYIDKLRVVNFVNYILNKFNNTSLTYYYTYKKIFFQRFIVNLILEEN